MYSHDDDQAFRGTRPKPRDIVVRACYDSEAEFAKLMANTPREELSASILEDYSLELSLLISPTSVLRYFTPALMRIGSDIASSLDLQLSILRLYVPHYDDSDTVTTSEHEFKLKEGFTSGEKSVIAQWLIELSPRKEFQFELQDIELAINRIWNSQD